MYKTIPDSMWMLKYKNYVWIQIWALSLHKMTQIHLFSFQFSSLKGWELSTNLYIYLYGREQLLVKSVMRLHCLLSQQFSGAFLWNITSFIPRRFKLKAVFIAAEKTVCKILIDLMFVKTTVYKNLPPQKKRKKKEKKERHQRYGKDDL